MDSRDNFRERCAALEAHVHTVERRRWWRLPWRVASVVALGLILAGVQPLQAKTFHCGAGDVQCLIDAIHTANANGQKNTIRLEAGTYTLTASDNDTNGPNGLPSITSRLSITGTGATTTSIERERGLVPPFRILHVAAAGSLTLNGLTIQRGSGADGSGIFNSGTLRITHSTITNNRGAFGAAQGGGIFNSGTLRITHSTITDNTLGPAPGASVGGGIFNSGTLRITHSTITTNGVGRGVGGGITNSAGGTATLTHSTIADNFAVFGAGIENGGTLTLIHSTIANNTAEGGPGGDGAGIRNSGTLTLTHSTIANNTTPQSGDGAGIFNFGPFGRLTILNSTIANNISAFGSGAGIRNSATLTLTNSTIAGNIASGPASGGGIRNSGSGTVAVQNTILALNTASTSGPDCAGSVTSQGNNLIGNPTGCTITLLNTDRAGDPGLGDFTDNSTPGTGHFPLLPTSQAIDAGNDAVCPRRDQIGQRRIGPCDIGAIEFREKDDRQHDEEDDQHDVDSATAAD